MSMNPLALMMGGSLPPLGDLIKIPCAYCIGEKVEMPADPVTLYEGTLLCKPHVIVASTMYPSDADLAALPSSREVVDELRASAQRSARVVECGNREPHADHLWSQTTDAGAYLGVYVQCPGVE